MEQEQDSKSGENEAPKTPPPKRKALRRPIIAVPLLCVVVFLGALPIYSCTTTRTMRKQSAQYDHDPETGVIRGLEEVDLGPDDATEAVLMLHGFLGSRKDFAGLENRLAEAGFFVRVARLPGHGTTPDDFARRDPDEFLAAAVEDFTELRERFDKVHVLGFSMGGAIATKLASIRDVDRLVLIAPYYGVTYYWYYVLPPHVWNSLFGWAIPYVPKSDRFVKVNRREAVGELFSYRSVPTKGAKTLGELGRRAAAEGVPEAISAPVLVIHARGDEAASPKAAEAVFERIGSEDKRLHWHSDRINHHLLADFDGEEAKARIENFLRAGGP